MSSQQKIVTLCLCGCEKKTSGPKRKFVSGHHMRMEEHKVENFIKSLRGQF